MRAPLFGLIILLATSSAAGAEPLVVDPWLDQPLSEIIDPWAGSAVAALYETEEIVDPWASYRRAIPTAAFPLIE